MNTPDPQHRATLDSELDRLRNAPSYSIGEFVQNPLYERHTFQGVYSITRPDTGETIYIGKTNNGTTERGLADRIDGHISSDPKLMETLCINKDTLKNYRVRAIQIDDPELRGLVEWYCIALYRPIAIRFGRPAPNHAAERAA